MTSTPLRVTADTSKRRRFQPPITTFFSTSDPCSVPSTSSSGGGGNGAPARVSHHHYSAATSSPIPVVPGQVQSSLLSVGMRVRKSIADGYKTKGTFLEKSMSASSTTTTDGNDEDRDVVTDEGDAFSLPSSSQESVASSTGAANGGQKRAFDFLDYDDDDDDDDDDEGFGGSETGARTILAPSLGQQRRRFIAMKRQNQMKIVGAGAGGMDVDDFEDASFLRKRDEVDVDAF